MSCEKEIARKVFYHCVCQVCYCIAHCNGAYAEDYRWLLHKIQLNMKEMVLGDLDMFTELETFLLETSGTFRWRWSIGNQKTCRTHREIPKNIEPLADGDAILSTSDCSDCSDCREYQRLVWTYRLYLELWCLRMWPVWCSHTCCGTHVEPYLLWCPHVTDCR